MYNNPLNSKQELQGAPWVFVPGFYIKIFSFILYVFTIKGDLLLTFYGENSGICKTNIHWLIRGHVTNFCDARSIASTREIYPGHRFYLRGVTWPTFAMPATLLLLAKSTRVISSALKSIIFEFPVSTLKLLRMKLIKNTFQWLLKFHSQPGTLSEYDVALPSPRAYFSRLFGKTKTWLWGSREKFQDRKRTWW